MNHYERTPVANKINVSSFISFHYFEYVKSFEGIGESHNFWEMVYIDYGTVKIVSDNDVYYVSSGEGFLHAPNEFHNLLSTGDFASAFIFSFDCECSELTEIMSQVIKFYGEETRVIKQLYSLGQKIFEGPYNIFDQPKLIGKQDAPYGGIQMMKNLLECLLMLLIQHGRTQQTLIHGQEDDEFNNERQIVDKVIEILLSHIYQKISLDEICSQLSFSKSYILKIFKKQMGYSVMDYYNQMKIKEAKRLISEESYTYTEIARLLNFSSVHHFSNSFKQITNMTPSGYQKSIKNHSVI